jgi:hypothetical protein
MTGALDKLSRAYDLSKQGDGRFAVGTGPNGAMTANDHKRAAGLHEGHALELRRKAADLRRAGRAGAAFEPIRTAEGHESARDSHRNAHNSMKENDPDAGELSAAAVHDSRILKRTAPASDLAKQVAAGVRALDESCAKIDSQLAEIGETLAYLERGDERLKKGIEGDGKYIPWLKRDAAGVRPRVTAWGADDDKPAAPKATIRTPLKEDMAPERLAAEIEKLDPDAKAKLLMKVALANPIYLREGQR